MAENRNASAQSVNELTFEGDSVCGGSSAMHRPYAPPVTPPRMARSHPVLAVLRYGIRNSAPNKLSGERSQGGLGDGGGGFHGAEVAEGGEAHEPAVRKALDDGGGEGRR